MYEHCDINNEYISLHDCKADGISFDKNILSFKFSNGIWIMKEHPQNTTENVMATDFAQVDFAIENNPNTNSFCGVSLFVFTDKTKRKSICKNWSLSKLIKKVNSSKIKIDFISRYDGVGSVLYKCVLMYDKKPYYKDCEIIINTAKVCYKWNKLNSKRVW